MSFSVFSARSIGKDIQHSLGQEGFYFYMREIVEQKLFLRYQDAINGEWKEFSGIEEFIQSKDGLGISDLQIFKTCLVAVSHSKHERAKDAQWLINLIEPIIQWDQVDHFCELLGRSPESVDAILYPPKPADAPGLGKKQERKRRAYPRRLDQKGRDGLEQLLAMPAHKDYSLAVRPNPGGSKAEEITEGVALFFEADGGLPLEAQEALPDLMGLPEPTFTVWTGGKSLHQYWVAEEGQSLSPANWRKAQERLIAAAQEVAPNAAVDSAIKDPSRAMRVPGSIHPSSGERCRFHSESGHRYNLAALVEMLPVLAVPFGPSPRQKKWEESTGELQNLADLGKATDALAYLPPEHFTGYMQWLGVGMSLHAVTPALLGAWISWSKGMGDTFDEEECRAKWETFSLERKDGLGLGSLIRLAQKYGYRPPASADTSSRYTAGLSGVSGLSGVAAESVQGVRGLSIQERMALLREEAEGLLNQGALPLDRLPVLRDRASDLDLPVRDADLTKIIWEARRKNAPNAEALAPGDLLDFTPVPWCWEGLLMRKATNLVVALPKAGKTSLILEAIAAWSRGEAFLGRAFHGDCPPVLIVGSDQPQSDWGRMLLKVGLVSEERRLLAQIVGLFHSGAPLSLDQEGIERICSYAKDHPNLLVVIDSYSRCVSSLGVSERDAEIAGPLADLQEALGPYGATIVVIHHSNKGSRNESASLASRGSTALPAACSQILHLQRLEVPEGGQQNSLSGKRMLSTEGRGGAPEKFLLELDPEGHWLFRGDGDALLQEQERQKIVGALNDRQASALEHVEETWEESEGRIGLSAIALASLMELRGADPSRVARRLLEQLRERGLVRRKVINLGMGSGGLSTQYVPATPDTPDTPDTPAVKREEVSAVAETVSAPPQAPSAESEDSDLEPPVGEFQSVEVLQRGSWRNGWMVAEVRGEELELFRFDDPTDTLCLDRTLVRACRS